MEPTRLFDLIARQVSHGPIPDAVAAKVDGVWKTWSSIDVQRMADRASIALARLGVQPGERVAIISMNRPEWTFADLAILQLGAVTVPIYPTATPADYEFILGHAEISVAFVSTKAIYDKLASVIPRLPFLKTIYAFDQIDGLTCFADLLPAAPSAQEEEGLAARKATVKGDDLASLIYTSGTTGTPKGVMLTHANILSNVVDVIKEIPTAGLRRALSFLPLSHVFERMVNYLYQYSGIAIYYAESLDTVAKNLKEVHPNVFVTVPRLLEKIFDSIVANGAELTGAKRAIFDWSLRLGLAYDPDASSPLGVKLQIALARLLVFGKWRAALGGELKLVIVGGSALQTRLARVFWAAGIRVLEGYGMTETSPVIAFNSPGVHKLGTVGKKLASLQVRIEPEAGHPSGEGEIVIKGPTVMSGYYKNPEATRESLTADGWFRTGDIGTFLGDFLKITDRKKEMFKTSGGKYVAPLALEGKFKESPYISQIMVVGENQKYPAALIVPNMEALRPWCEQHGLSGAAPSTLLASEKVHDLFAAEVTRLNAGFGQWEKVKQFRLVPNVWSIDAGELTPKMSLKRKVIAAKYKHLIDDLYRRD